MANPALSPPCCSQSPCAGGCRLSPLPTLRVMLVLAAPQGQEAQAGRCWGEPGAGSLPPGTEHARADPCPGKTGSQPAPERAHPAGTSAQRMNSPAHRVTRPHRCFCSNFCPARQTRCPEGRSTTSDLKGGWTSSRMEIAPVLSPSCLCCSYCHSYH